MENRYTSTGIIAKAEKTNKEARESINSFQELNQMAKAYINMSQKPIKSDLKTKYIAYMGYVQDMPHEKAIVFAGFKFDKEFQDAVDLVKRMLK